VRLHPRLTCSVVALLALLLATAPGIGALTSAAALSVSKSTVTSVSIPFIPENLNSGGNSGTLGVLNGNIVVGDHAYDGHSSSCRIIAVNSHSLAIRSNSSDSCDDPGLDGENAAPIKTLTGPGGEFAQIRIAVRDSRTGKVDLGPVVMQCDNGSDDCPEWAYGGGYLWVFGPPFVSSSKTVQRPAEVLRISLSTGKVLTTVRMPQTSRIILAPDDDGLWFGQSNESGAPSGTPVLHFIPLGSTHYSAIKSAGVAVNWLVAARHTAWASVMTSRTTRSSELETFHGPSPPAGSVVDKSAQAGAIDPAEGVFDAPEVLEVTPRELVAAVAVGDTAPFSPTKIFGITPTTGRIETSASLENVGIGVFDGRLIYDGALFVLSVGVNNATLFRVPLKSVT
jgi:hypothetical protein